MLEVCVAYESSKQIRLNISVFVLIAAGVRNLKPQRGKRLDFDPSGPPGAEIATKSNKDYILSRCICVRAPPARRPPAGCPPPAVRPPVARPPPARRPPSRPKYLRFYLPSLCYFILFATIIANTVFKSDSWFRGPTYSGIYVDQNAVKKPRGVKHHKQN